MPTSIILDTDIDTDCDDAGALMVLHALCDVGECRLLGVICSVPVPSCAGAARALNEAGGRSEIPVGTVHVPHYETAPEWRPYREHREKLARAGRLYNDRLASTRPAGEPPPEEAVSLYRRLLAAEPNQSVTLCAIGTCTALAQLLASGPDIISPLSGRELVAAKVIQLVAMAAAPYPTGTERFNWRMDLCSAAAVISEWPTPLVVSVHGTEVLTGAQACRIAPQEHPFRIAYEKFLGGPDRNRSSWDQLAVLYAVRGVQHGPFELSADLGLTFDSTTGEYRWLDRSQPVRRYISPILPDRELAHLVEDLMTRAVHLQPSV